MHILLISLKFIFVTPPCCKTLIQVTSFHTKLWYSPCGWIFIVIYKSNCIIVIMWLKFHTTTPELFLFTDEDCEMLLEASKRSFERDDLCLNYCFTIHINRFKKGSFFLNEAGKLGNEKVINRVYDVFCIDQVNRCAVWFQQTNSPWL